MSDRTLEHHRNRRGRERKAIEAAAYKAVRDWQETGDAELPMQRLARAMHDARKAERSNV